MNKFYEDLENELVEKYKEGYSLRQISEMFNINKTTVKKYVSNHVELRVRGLTDKEKENVKELYREGMTVNAISKKINKSYSTVKRYLSKEFGTVTDGIRKYEHLIPSIKKDYMNGLSATEISEKYNISRQTALDYIAEEGVKVRTYSETSRVYDLKEDYFDKLDEDKAFVLGKIFAIGTINAHPNCRFLDLSIPKRYEYVINDICSELYVNGYPKTSIIDTTLKIRIASTHLTERLLDLGVHSVLTKDNIRTNLHEDIVPFKHNFFEGYFSINVSVYPRVVYISSHSHVLPIINNYIKNDLQIDKFLVNDSNAIVVERNEEVLKLTDRHKIILDMIIDVANREETHSWNKVIKKYNT